MDSSIPSNIVCCAEKRVSEGVLCIQSIIIVDNLPEFLCDFVTMLQCSLFLVGATGQHASKSLRSKLY